MKEAIYCRKLNKDIVQCIICPHNCIIKNGARGKCKVRENKAGKLYSLVYGKPCAVNIDPIEKKPQYHFLPGTKSFSVGTAGCNLKCKFCQNSALSQSSPEEIPAFSLSPEKTVEEAIKSKCSSIAYTYNDPVVFYEYALDTAKIAKKSGLKNIFVTNGFINPEPLKELCKVIDGFHVDLKGFTEEFYNEVCSARLKPVLESLKIMKQENIWFEIIYLLIPALNDDMKKIKEMSEWIVKALGKDTVLHFSRFFPDYLLQDIQPTTEKSLLEAANIAKKAGLKYVYIGNIELEKWSNTYCPECSELLIERRGFQVLQNKIEHGKCFNCKENIAGVWK